MLLIVLLTVVLVGAVGLLAYIHGHDPDGPRDYGAITAYEAKKATIEEAGSVEELDEMWAAWERRGYSRDGLLYAHVLERKKELGETLSLENARRLRAADRAWKRAKNLPRITGRVR